MHRKVDRKIEVPKYPGRMTRLIAGAALCAGTLGIGAAVSSSASAGQKVTLTVWQNGSLASSGLQFMSQVAKNFEKVHPGVTINFVPKPPDDYFALLLTAMIGKVGPDVFQTYPGTYSANLEPYLLNLTPYVSKSVLKSLAGIDYFGVDNDPEKDAYGLPTVVQFYNGWYNKALFKKAGIASPPTDYSQMTADCKTFTSKGITAFADGIVNITTPGSGAVHDFSSLADSTLTLKQWNEILNGKIPFTTPSLVKTVSEWAKLYKAGCTGKNVTTQNASDLFQTGKVAMVFNFSGMYSQYYPILKSNLGAMVTPWSATPTHQLVELPGSGYVVSKASPNAKLAAEFVAFTDTPASQQLASASGQVPVLANIPTIGATAQLVALANSGKVNLYPMFDNFLPQEVVAQLDNALPQAFIGAESASAALNTLEQAFKSLPANEQTSQYHLGS